MAVRGKAGNFRENVVKAAKEGGVAVEDVKVEIDHKERAENGNVHAPATKQKRLPGVDDPEIEEIEEAAENYADTRDKRIAMLKKELDLKDVVLQVMKRHKKTSYRHGNLEIEIVPEGEKLKVKINEED